MPNSRERIMAAIRQSLARAQHLPAAARVALAPEPATEREALLERFAAELALVGGVCERMAEPGAVAQRVAALAAEAGAAEAGVLAWAEDQLPVPGLHQALRGAGFDVLSEALPHSAAERTAALARLERCRVGLTGADAALAETGTLALRTGPGRPRLASLSVTTHVAVVTPQQFWLSWAAWLQGAAGPGWVRQASNLTLITGPSRTGDIEMTLTVGVHGPRFVHVIIAG